MTSAKGKVEEAGDWREAVIRKAARAEYCEMLLAVTRYALCREEASLERVPEHQESQLRGRSKINGG